jgi:Domain of Unknown Function (DUF1206)
VTHPDLQRATGPAASALDALIRVGFAAKGIVTILVGVLALRYALREGGGLTGQEGAVEWVLHHPFGGWMLAVLAVGLASYALWMFVAAFVDPERKGERFQAIAERLGFFATGIGYVLLASTAFALLVGRKGEGALDLQHFLATVLTPHVGRVLVGLAGVIVMTAGMLQLRLGITRRFRDTLQSGLSPLERLLTGVSGTLGYVTLGIFSLIVGWSLVEVAVEYDPSEASGWPGALQLLSGLGHGRWLLAAAAVGLICYGLYFVLQVRYRRL